MVTSIQKRTLIYAGALWLIAFLLFALLATLRIPADSISGGFILLLAALYVTWWFAARLRVVSISQGLAAGATWLAINVVLDYIVIVQGLTGGNFILFSLWIVWGRYALLLLVPIIVAARKHAE